VYRGTQIPKVSLKFEKKSGVGSVHLMHFEPSMQRWARQRPVHVNPKPEREVHGP